MNKQTIQKEVGTWLEQNWTISRTLKEWRNMLIEAGWAAPHWPTEFFGRGFSTEQNSWVDEMFIQHGAIGAAQVGPRNLAAVTILSHGSPNQKKRYLPGILSGDEAWCQLFSEPGSGSDLAGATTKAVLDGDNWIVNGQKVWTTSAHHADFGILLARTDWDVPKHQGLSYFLINMRQPGIEVRPLRQMNGHASFNEVFMTDAQVSKEDLVGNVGDGWATAMTTLSFERLGFTQRANQKSVEQLEGPIYDEFRAELAVANEPYTWYPQRTGRTDLALPRAINNKTISDPVVRQELAKLLTLNKSAKWTAERAASNRSADQKQSPEGSLGKLAASLIARQAAHVHTLISGTDAMLTDDIDTETGLVAEILLSTPAISIAGGTDEIQRNIIAERVLGLPKEARSDGGPFRDVKRNLADQ